MEFARGSIRSASRASRTADSFSRSNSVSIFRADLAMEPPPFLEEPDLVALDDTKCLSRVCQVHVVVLPERGAGVFIAQLDQHLAAARTFDVHVRWLVLARRRVDIDCKRALVMDPNHGGI